MNVQTSVAVVATKAHVVPLVDRSSYMDLRQAGMTSTPMGE